MGCVSLKSHKNLKEDSADGEAIAAGESLYICITTGETTGQLKLNSWGYAELAEVGTLFTMGIKAKEAPVETEEDGAEKEVPVETEEKTADDIFYTVAEGSNAGKYLAASTTGKNQLGAWAGLEAACIFELNEKNQLISNSFTFTGKYVGLRGTEVCFMAEEEAAVTVSFEKRTITETEIEEETKEELTPETVPTEKEE